MVHTSYGEKDDQLEDICDAAKSEGILVFSVAFGAPQAGKDVLEYCATVDAMYFDATTGADLETAFDQIAGAISELRLTQ